MTRRLTRTDDSGSALIQVLVIVTVLFLGVTALLSLGETSIRTTVNLRAQAADTYNADGATHAAIDAIRENGYGAKAGTHCFGASDTLELKKFYGADSAAVTCVPDPMKVLIHCTPGGACNRPGSAILTTGTVASGEEGIHIEQPNADSAFRVKGTIYSNSSINVTKGVLENLNGRVYAEGSCPGPGTIKATAGAVCNYGDANVLAADPGYTPDISAAPAYQAVPHAQCAAKGPESVITFEPGYYDDGVGLSKIMAGNSACKNSTWWFKPGVYYFDFHNSGSVNHPSMPSGDNIWTINDGSLVAGTPVDADGARLGGPPPLNPTIPGSCENPIDTPLAAGVQFIFGGDSRLAIKAGKAEICASYNDARPMVGVYGLTAGSAVAETPKLTASNPVTSSASGFPNPTPAARLASADGDAASWTSANKNGTATLTLEGFTAPAIPLGSTLTGATVKVVHRHTVTGTDRFTATFRPTGGGSLQNDAPGRPADTQWGTTSIVLPIGGASHLAQQVHRNTFTGGQLELKVDTAAAGAMEEIDSVQLELSYEPPALRKGSGCLTNGPYTGVGNSATRCALITSESTSENAFYVQGTTYTPGAAIDLTLNNKAEEVFRFGIVVRSLWIKLTGSLLYTGPVIEVPADSPGHAFSTYLAAYVCPNAITCTPTGDPVLRAKVAFVDNDPVLPTPGRRQVVVLSWSRPG